MTPTPPVVPAADALLFEERAVARLREGGFRITMPRLEVIRVLGGSGVALSAYAIHDRVKQRGGRIDVVTVYRILDTLMAVHVVHHIGALAGYIACRLEGEHATQVEHAICTTCGRVEELEVDEALRAAAAAPASRLDFAPERLNIEVLGVCGPCRHASDRAE